MLKKLYIAVASLTFGLWLTAGAAVLLAAGSFLQGEGSAINDIALWTWLTAVPAGESWWLWGTVFLLLLLAGNTVLCSIEAIRRSPRISSVPPQLMHLGFLLIMLAHAVDARGSVKQAGVVREGSIIPLPSGNLAVSRIAVRNGPMGFPTDYGVELVDASGARETTGPNRPVFRGGVGVYVKQATDQPFPQAVVELHREPGAGLALAGGILFVAGNLFLLARRRRGGWDSPVREPAPAAETKLETP